MVVERDEDPRVDTNVLVDSKREYIEKLERCLSQPIYNALKNILQDAMNVAEVKDMDELECFSQLLSEVPSWNADIVDSETREVMQAAPYLKELLKAYFVCASMILGSIRKSHHTEPQRLRVKVPTCERFVHSIVKMMAADIADDIPHFLTQSEEGEYKLSKRHVMKGVSECIKNTLHSFTTSDDILKGYMDDIMGDEGAPAPRAHAGDDEPHAERTKSFKLGSSVLKPGKHTFADEEDDDNEMSVMVEEDEDF
eukprot:jgi/Mesvir1/16616/Mv10150-RA.1